jgi:hypothetical protein
MLKKNVEKLLMGPLNPDENGVEILDSPPLDTYLTGILWPLSDYAAFALLEESEQEKLPVKENYDQGNNDSGDTDEGAPLHSIIKPSSVGLTFHLPSGETSFKIEVTGARYQKTASDLGFDLRDSGEGTTDIWKRIPFYYTVNSSDLQPGEYLRLKKFKDPDGVYYEPGFLEISVRRRFIDNMLAVTATVINRSVPDEDRNSSALFQVSLSASVDETDCFYARKQTFKSSDEDRTSNNLIYMYAREFAVGHGIAAGWEPVDPEKDVKKVYTTWIPVWKLNSISPEGHPDLNVIKAKGKSILKAAVLGIEGNREETLEQLRGFVTVYDKWIDKQAENIKYLEGELRDTAGDHINLCKTVVKRMCEGISFLAGDENAWVAFCLANQVMDNQAKGPSRSEDQRNPLIWRPFQLAFLLLTLKSTADSNDAYRNCMDLLWFPTGGGKTEAYLALTAFIIFYQRLINPEYRDKSSVTVIMRYTLRLLTIQQFQRAAAMICAANLIRRNDPNRLGETPISLGLWVGSGATPNRLFPRYPNDNSALEALEKERQAPPRPTSTPVLLLICPYCGTKLNFNNYKLNQLPESLDIICPNEKCPGKGEPLPVHTVDTEIYSRRPSLIIATVDKFAQLPRNADTGNLFGIPDGLPPSLIIQDELHLISGPLGTVCGLYETAIDFLCSRNDQMPKVIGSTATIGRAKSQVINLFNRSVSQFPPPVLDARHSFFAEENKEQDGRLYLGISSSGRSPKFTLQAVTAVLLQITQSMYDSNCYSEKDIDPYWTTALYFNSLRELGGADFMLNDDIPKSITFYANRLETPNRAEIYKEELTSRVSSVDIPDKLENLGVELGCDILSEGKPIDALLASNMISVGVDIGRLGLMIVNGQPKTTAEYIQATSRVGRQKPGIIYTVYNASKPRDLSHFEHFCGYHGALYRSVEATSVTPWSPRARDRALHAVLASMVRHGVNGMTDELSAINWDPNHPESLRIKDAIIKRACGVFQSPLKDSITEQLDVLIRHWQNRIRLQKERQKDLCYFYKPSLSRNREPFFYLMRSAEEVFDDPSRLIWRVPNSMRSVEPSVLFTIWQ